MSRSAALLAATLLLACSPPAPEPADETSNQLLLTGVWRAEVEQLGRQLPFNFEVTLTDTGYAVTYLNGPERMPVETVRLEDDGYLELNFPSYSSGLSAQIDGDHMSGEISLARRNKVHRLPFSARHGQAHRFFPEPAAEYKDFNGRWEVSIQVPAFDFTEPALALFTQRGSTLSGTVQTQVGDYRFLHGEVRGNELYLSTFDGGGTQLWLAQQQEDGSLQGSFDSVTYGAANWTARRNPDFQLPDPNTLTYMKEGEERLQFSFRDLDGQVVTMNDARFENKVVLVVLGGSWCSTCHDEAQFMVPFYENHQDRGLEVIYIMFEYSDVFAEVEPQLRAFQARYDIKHPILFAGDSSRETRSEKLPMLNKIIAFPTTLFVDRRGNVRRIHTAFPGPATGQAHEDYKREFRAFVDLLLSETA